MALDDAPGLQGRRTGRTATIWRPSDPLPESPHPPPRIVIDAVLVYGGAIDRTA
jgi:hypothetical protein